MTEMIFKSNQSLFEVINYFQFNYDQNYVCLI